MSGNPKAKQDGGAAAPGASAKSANARNVNPQGVNTVWGARFNSAPDDLMTAINASVSFDCRLYAQDITASKAHAEMLVAQGIIPAEDGAKIQAGLNTIWDEIADGRFAFKSELEDIHMNIEARLSDMIGSSAGRLHTARSINAACTSRISWSVRYIRKIFFLSHFQKYIRHFGCERIHVNGFTYKKN